MLNIAVWHRCLTSQGKKYAEAVEKRDMCIAAVERDDIDADAVQDSPEA